MDMKSTIIGIAVGFLYTGGDQLAMRLRTKIGPLRSLAVWFLLTLLLAVDIYLYAKSAIVTALLVAILTSMAAHRFNTRNIERAKAAAQDNQAS